VHARPPQSLVAPLRVSYLALLSPWAQRPGEYEKKFARRRQHQGDRIAAPDAALREVGRDTLGAGQQFAKRERRSFRA
jgi:hypothetical protein